MTDHDVDRDVDGHLEQQLRATLRGRAATVTSGPLWPGPQERDGEDTVVPADLVDAPAADLAERRRRRRWLAPLAAAAAVVALGVGLAVHTDDPGPSPALPRTCPTSLPASWRTAIAAPPVDADTSNPALSNADRITGDAIIGTTPRGIVVTAARGGAEDVLLVTASGTRRVATVPDLRRTAIGSISVDGDHLLIPIRGGQGVDAQNEDTLAITDLALIDLRTGTRTRLAGTSPADRAAERNLVGDGVLLDGHVYWTVTARVTDSVAVTVDHDIATGRETRTRSSVFHSPTRTWTSVTGLTGQPAPTVPGAPGGAVRAERGDGSARTDGRNWAWVQGDDLLWSRGGTSKVLRYRQQVGNPQLLAVAGPFVFYDAPGNGNPILVIDMRSGAVARTGLLDEGQAAASGSAVALTVPALDGQDPDGVTLRLDTGRLSPLECR